MSVISTAFDAFHSVLANTLTSHVELIDPYDPELNDDITYSAAYGLAIAEGTNTERVLSCNYTVRRNFILTLTRKVMKGGLQRNTAAISVRKTAEKNLFEDLHAIIQSLETNTTLNSSSSGVAWCKYTGDSGLEYIRSEDNQLIMVRAIFECEYFEDIT